MKLKMVYGAVIAVLLLSTNSFASDLKIGIVEMEYVLQNSSKVNESKNYLQGKFNDLQADLSKKEKALKDKREDFESQKLLFSDEVKKAKEAELKNEEDELVKTLKGYQGEIKAGEQTIIKAVFDKIQKIAADDGYSLVIEKNTGHIIYSAPEIDISKKITEQYDTKKE